MAKTIIRLTTTGPVAKRWAVMITLAVIVTTGLLFVRNVLAVHDRGLFELDRNAIDNPAVQGEDWDDVFNQTDTAAASVFIADGEGPTIFTGGGSKDDLDTTQWKHKDGSTPDKDELLDGFAARYGNVLYFGADRTANNGDAQMGFWFFQQEVVPQAGGVFGPGQHEDGDILILSDFSGGGKNVTIRVFQWNGPGGSIPGSGAINGTLDLLAGSLASPADCVGPPSVPANDPFCATVNNAVETAPWPFDPKVGGPGSFQIGEFYEGGIDLAFLGLENECFASFLVETRASTSVDATLKDFVGGSFQPCESGLKTTPVNGSGNPITSIILGQSIQDHALVTGTGSNAAPTGTVDFFICSPAQLTNGACETGGTAVSTETLVPIANTTTSQATSDPFTPNSIGTWCFRGVYSGDDNYPAATDATTGECFQVVQLQPTITTAQTWTLKDSATVSVASGGGNLAGSLLFELFVNSATCQGSPILTTTKSVSGALSSSQDSDTLTITTPGGPTTYSWRVTYTSTNAGHNNVASACHTENSTLTFTNGS